MQQIKNEVYTEKTYLSVLSGKENRSTGVGIPKILTTNRNECATKSTSSQW